mmetsp:Transcript_13240/g.32328  ORF Transcript_13240/g.32328 Transcript_13240/m.32328 type:complete len:795 (-) Transcript_13240:542-2926(-)|eukprot:CAMPEP_0178986078 /NCGR_PEP_ID=MMETSP0795-20121207/2504_1 /TAXON_ID=88552 /ORGANISM="Amoebophrya sp., Strain Ameob2" /LENGTH=794 /DNA_ID=CAMNT_0020677099 /DNA_START=24 /DNA_END=2408 /DNA_ORIENTATION=+
MSAGFLSHDYGPQYQDQPLPWQNVTSDVQRSGVGSFSPNRSKLQPREPPVTAHVTEQRGFGPPSPPPSGLSPKSRARLMHPVPGSIARSPVLYAQDGRNIIANPQQQVAYHLPPAGGLSHELDKQLGRYPEEMNAAPEQVPVLLGTAAPAPATNFGIGETQRSYLHRQAPTGGEAMLNGGKLFAPLNRDRALLMQDEIDQTAVNNYTFLPKCYQPREGPPITVAPEKERGLWGQTHFGPDRSLFKYARPVGGDPFLTRYVPRQATVNVSEKPNMLRLQVLDNPNPLIFAPDLHAHLENREKKAILENQKLQRDHSPQRESAMWGPNSDFGPAVHSPTLHKRLDTKRGVPALMPGNPTRAMVPKARYSRDVNTRNPEAMWGVKYEEEGFGLGGPGRGGREDDVGLGIGIGPINGYGSVGGRGGARAPPTLLEHENEFRKNELLAQPKNHDSYSRSADPASPRGILRDYKTYVENQAIHRQHHEKHLSDEEKKRVEEMKRRNFYGGRGNNNGGMGRSSGMEAAAASPSRCRPRGETSSPTTEGAAREASRSTHQEDRNLFLDNQDLTLRQLMQETNLDHGSRMNPDHRRVRGGAQQGDETTQGASASPIAMPAASGSSFFSGNSPSDIRKHGAGMSPRSYGEKRNHNYPQPASTQVATPAGGDTAFLHYKHEGDGRGKATSLMPEPVAYDNAFFGPAKSRVLRLATGSDPSGVDSFPTDPNKHDPWQHAAKQKNVKDVFEASKRQAVAKHSLNESYYNNFPAKISHRVAIPGEETDCRRSPCLPKDAGFFQGRFKE